MNQSNKTNKTQPSIDFCTQLTDVYNSYIEKSIGACSFALNLLCIVVFTQMIRFQKEEVYKYLLFKSIVDSFISLRVAFKSVLNCTGCVVDKMYALKLIYLIFFIYIEYAAELLSILIQIAANFNRYRLLSQRFGYFDKISYKLAIFLMSLYSFLFYIYMFFDNTIASKTSNNETIYLIKETGLGAASIYVGYIHSVSRNVVCVAFIFVLNILTMRIVKMALSKKKHMLNKKYSNKKKKVMSKTEKVELRLTLMVMATSAVIFFAYGMSFIKWLKIEVIYTNKCYVTFTYIIYWISFSLDFFIYFYFNLSFKRFLFFIGKSKKDIHLILTTQNRTVK